MGARLGGHQRDPFLPAGCLLAAGEKCQCISCFLLVQRNPAGCPEGQNLLVECLLNASHNCLCIASILPVKPPAADLLISTRLLVLVFLDASRGTSIFPLDFLQEMLVKNHLQIAYRMLVGFSSHLGGRLETEISFLVRQEKKFQSFFSPTGNSLGIEKVKL